MEATDLLLVNTLNQAANQGDSLEEIIRRLTKLTSDAFDCNGATVYLCSDDGASLAAQNLVLPPRMLQRIEALIGTSLPRLSVPLGPASTYRKVLVGGKPVILDTPEAIGALATEFTDNRAWRRLVPSIMKMLGIRSVILVPLVAEGRPIGLIDASRVRPFTDQDARRFEVISAQMTGIIRRKQAEEALRASEQVLTLVLDSISDIVFYQDLNNRVIWANRAAEASTGLAGARLTGRPCHEMWKRDAPCERCPVLEVIRTGELRETELELPSRTWQVRFYPARGATGAVEGVIEVARDITDQKRAARALQESEERYRQLVETYPDPVVIVQDDTVRFANQVFSERLGYSARDVTDNLRFSSMTQRCDQEAWSGPVPGQADGPDLPQPCLITREGDPIAVEISRAEIRHEGRPAELMVIRDVTERLRAEKDRKLLERQFQQRQKLESIGVLAGGIAHDFNNLLTGVLGNSDMALMSLQANSPVRPLVEQIDVAGRRLSELTSQLLAYSGKGKMVVRTTDLNHQVREMSQLLRLSLSKQAVLELHLAEDLPGIEVDRSQLGQVVMNLITNASDAVDEHGGTVSLRTGVVEVDQESRLDLYLDDELAQGLYVSLEVSDSGHGMDRETTARVFEPFFSTKFTGRGLGLAAVMGIVRGHGGAIRVDSEPGRGTTFQVFLPASAAPVAEDDRRRDDRGGPLRGTVLVVDDEETVRTVAQQMLAGHGFTVLSAADGEEALQVFREHKDEICVVLLDLTMPRMGGEETLKQLRDLRQDVKVVLMSGFSETDARSRFSKVKPERFIHKPFDSRTLLSSLRGALEGQGP